MSEVRDIPGEDENKKTQLEELNDEGVGATIGEKDTFEPEESEGVEEKE